VPVLIKHRFVCDGTSISVDSGRAPQLTNRWRS